MSKVREKIKLTSYDELLKVDVADGLKWKETATWAVIRNEGNG